MRSRSTSRSWTRSGRSWQGCAVALSLLVACSGGSKEPTLAPRREISNKYKMAQVHLSQGRAQEAIPLLKEVIRHEPHHAEAHNLLGVVYWSLGQAREAQAELERALEISPYLSDARVNLGVLYSEEGDFEQARLEFERALQDRTYPTPEKPLVNLAVNEIKLGRPSEALVRAEEAIRHNPFYARAYDVFVDALRQADPKVASVEYRTLVRDHARSQDFHLNLGEAFLNKEDRRRARFHLEKVVDINPSSEQAGKARKKLDTLR